MCVMNKIINARIELIGIEITAKCRIAFACFCATLHRKLEKRNIRFSFSCSSDHHVHDGVLVDE